MEFHGIGRGNSELINCVSMKALAAATVSSKVMFPLLLVLKLLLTSLCMGSLLDPVFVVYFFVSFPILQSFP